MGWLPVTSASSWAQARIFFPTKNIKEEGYIFVYLTYSSDSTKPVDFDDLKVTHTKSNLVQYNEYYPFGLQTANSWTRENSTGNNFLGNGGTELNSTSKLYDLEYRNYDPVLARMNGVDPLAGKYSSMTPYNYSFNDPVGFNDPTGADPFISRDYWRGNMSGGAIYNDRPIDGSSAYGGGGIIRSGNTYTIDFDRIGAFGNEWNYQSGCRNLSEQDAWKISKAHAERYNPTLAFGGSPEGGRNLAIHNATGDFVEIDEFGHAYVPYTNISYWDYLAANMLNVSALTEGGDESNSWLDIFSLEGEISIGVQGGINLNHDLEARLNIASTPLIGRSIGREGNK